MKQGKGLIRITDTTLDGKLPLTFCQDVSEVDFLALIIPFEETGAIETFLLDALCETSEKEDKLKTDKIIIEQCRTFIDNINSNGKYLCHRREKTKPSEVNARKANENGTVVPIEEQGNNTVPEMLKNHMHTWRIVYPIEGLRDWLFAQEKFAQSNDQIFVNFV